eukprot:2888592-Pyramimonas_sp.AAC.1
MASFAAPLGSSVSGAASSREASPRAPSGAVLAEDVLLPCSCGWARGWLPTVYFMDPPCPDFMDWRRVAYS